MSNRKAELDMYVDETRAKKLEELVRSQGWGPIERTLANGTLQLLTDRRKMNNRSKAALDLLEAIIKDEPAFPTVPLSELKAVIAALKGEK
jgi:hypothetical protein